MTEEEWRSCRDVWRMLVALYSNSAVYDPVTGPNVDFAFTAEKHEEEKNLILAGKRVEPPGRNKDILFLAACYRRIEYLLIPEARRLLDLHELDADEELPRGQEAKAWKQFEAARKRRFSNAGGLASARRAAAKAARWLLHGCHDTDLEAVFEEINEAVRRDPNYSGGPEGEAPHQADLLRDIYGTPYKQVQFSKQWRTDTAVALAKQMYDSRDFGAMPILADALQDAGCEDEDILNHCRDGNQVHVRGCWVVDLVLGKA